MKDISLLNLSCTLIWCSAASSFHFWSLLTDLILGDTEYSNPGPTIKQYNDSQFYFMNAKKGWTFILFGFYYISILLISISWFSQETIEGNNNLCWQMILKILIFKYVRFLYQNQYLKKKTQLNRQ